MCWGLAKRLKNKSLHSRYFDEDDAYQEARIFLLEAAAMYDGRKSRYKDSAVAENTYYVAHVWGKLRSWAKTQLPIHVPHYLLDAASKADAAAAVGTADGEAAEVAQRKLTRNGEQYLVLARAARFALQPPEHASDGGNSSPDDWAGAALEAEMLSAEDLAALHAAIANLPKARMRDVIRLRYFASPKLTLQQIGDRFGVSKEAIRLEQAKALWRLRRELPWLR